MARQGLSLKSVKINDFLIFYEKKDVKNLLLKIDENGAFKLSIPRFCTLEKAFEFVRKNEIWMQKINKKLKAQKANLKENEVKFLCRIYELKINKNYQKCFFQKNVICAASDEDFKRFLMKNSKIIFNFYLKKWSKITGLNFSHLSIKNMKTRWGSCNSKKAYINLNLRLIEKSLKFIEYVILHEIAHLKHPNHSSEFYAFLRHFMSDFDLREKESRIC